jgi:hypothetical protein
MPKILFQHVIKSVFDAFYSIPCNTSSKSCVHLTLLAHLNPASVQTISSHMWQLLLHDTVLLQVIKDNAISVKLK